jgi:hypothetical protein
MGALTTICHTVLLLATFGHAKHKIKEEVQFRGESYNVTTGCPSKNPEVLRSTIEPFI